MIKIKAMLAISVILLFLGIAISPAIAQTTENNQVAVGTSDGATPVQLTEIDLSSMQRIIPTLMEKMSKATSITELRQTVQSAITEFGRMPVLVAVLKLIIKAIDFNVKISLLRPLRKNAFIMSWGFTNKFLSLGKNKLNVLRPLTGWYYSGKSNFIVNSRTIILDPYPFSIKMLTGRQIGLMTNFGGLYIHRSGGLAEKAITFFFGIAGTIRSIDLSPFNK